jgi:hypothetical protein
MSIPSGKLGNSTNLWDYESRKARERTAAERYPTEDETNPLRSPYAPKRAHKPAGMERHPVEKDRDPLRSPYEPTRARAQSAVAPDFVITDDVEPPAPMRAREGSRERPAAERHTLRADEAHRYAYDTSGAARAVARPLSADRDGHSPKTAIEEGITGAHPVDRDAAASFQPAHPSSGRYQLSAAERRDEIVSDHDLKRLEASLRRLQRQEAAARLPRATLPPVPALASVDARSVRHSGETSGDGFRSPRSLEPERLVPPPAMSRRNIRAPLGILIVSILVATIAYYLATGGWAPPEPAPEPQRTPTVIAPPSWSTGHRAPQPPMAQDDDRATLAQTEISSQRNQTSQPARSSEGKIGAMLQPGEPGAQAPSPGKANRTLDPEEIKLLTKQGEQFAAAGDLVAARILFQRAAEAGDVTAATALGATYDPNVLAKLGVVGKGADVEKARSWYRKAESFGSPEASRRLNALANR